MKRKETNYERGMEYIVCAMLLVIPLYVAGRDFFPYTTPKTLLMIIGVSLLCVLFVLAKTRERTFSLSFTALHGVLLVFLGVLTISAIHGVNPRVSFFGTLQQGTGVILLYALALYASIVGYLIRRREGFLPVLLSVSVASATIVAALTYGGSTILPSAGGGATLGNTSYTGPYLLFNICIAIGLFSYHTKAGKKVLIAASALVMVCSPIFINPLLGEGRLSLSAIIAQPTLVLGAANAAAIGLILALCVIAAICAIRSKKAWLAWVGVIVFIAIFVGSAAIGRVFINPSSRLHRLYAQEKTDNRFIFWDIAGAGFDARPDLGWGYGNYDKSFQRYFDPVLFSRGYSAEQATNQPHNVIWEYLSTTGIVGLLGYLALFGATFCALFFATKSDRRKRVLYGALAGALVGYFFQNLFIFDTPVTYLLFFSIIGVALSTIDKRWTMTLSLSARWRYIVVGLTCVGAVIAGVVLVVRPSHESRALYALVTDTAYVPRPIAHISLMGNANDIALVAGKFYAAVQDAPPTQTDLYARRAQRLVDGLADALHEDPDNARALLVRGTLSDLVVAMSGKADPVLLQSAEHDLDAARIANPNIPDTYFALAQNALYQRQLPAAYTYIRAGIAVAPTYEQGYAIAHRLLSIAPDKKFERYVLGMEDAWMKK